jgi:hypothetical protein
LYSGRSFRGQHQHGLLLLLLLLLWWWWCNKERGSAW